MDRRDCLKARITKQSRLSSIFVTFFGANFCIASQHC